jgi:hypothetical protein
MQTLTIIAVTSALSIGLAAASLYSFLQFMILIVDEE